MTRTSVRQYHSPTRERRASITRRNITEAAEILLLSHGYAKTTVEDIARKAGVSKQTIYAVFGSKRGIIAAIIDTKLTSNDTFMELCQNSLKCKDALEALHLTVNMVRKVHEIQSPTYALLKGSGVLDPELAIISKAREKTHQEQADKHILNILTILNSDPVHALKPGMNQRTAQDIFWCLSNRELYRILVQERGWTGEAYTSWLYEMLVSSLFEKRNNTSIL